MSKFAHCSVDVLSSLLFTHCSSFHGCPLWNLRSIDAVLVAWKKCVKRVWKLNMRTRSKFVKNLHHGDLFSILLTRSFDFYVQCFKSENEIVKLSFRMCLNSSSIVNENVHLCSTYASIDLEPLFDEPKRVRKVLKRPRSDIDTLTQTQALVDLCLIRDGVLSPEFELDLHEISFAFSFFTT